MTIYDYIVTFNNYPLIATFRLIIYCETRSSFVSHRVSEKVYLALCAHCTLRRLQYSPSIYLYIYI